MSDPEKETPEFKGVLGQIRKWAEFVRFSHTLFALPFALSAMALAARDTHGWPGWRVFLLVLTAMVGARTCAMAFNRIVDRRIDAVNPRTADRHLPAGRISLGSAWTLWAVSAAVFVGACYGLNRVCLYLSPVALFVVCFYSLTKRFTDFTHVFLGVALGLAPIGAWLAVRGGMDLFPVRDDAMSIPHSGFLAILLSFVVVFWLVGFDIIYAMQDHEFDRQHGLHSLVVRWGARNALKAAFLAHVIMLLLLMAFGLLSGFRVAYFPGMLIIIGSVLLEHWIARRRALNWVQISFFKLNALISTVFLVVTLAEIVFPGFRLVK